MILIALLKLPGVGRKECKPDHGRCVWKTGDRYGYTLYPAVEPDRTGRWNQRSEKSGDGTMEDHSAGGRQ